MYWFARLSGLRKVIFSFLFVTVAFSLSAQDKDAEDLPKWLLAVAGGAAGHNMIDYSFSALPYSAFIPGGSIAVTLQKSHVLHQLHRYYANGKLNTKKGSQNNLSTNYINVDYTNLYNLGQQASGSFGMMVGGAINVLYAKRNYNDFINNKTSFEFAASLSAVAKFSYFFGNNFSISDQLTVPLLTSLEQPAFGSTNTSGYINNNGSGFKSFLQSNRVVMFGSYLRLMNDLRVTKKIGDAGVLSLIYSWDYYQIKTSRQVKQADHRLEIAYSFIL